MMSGIKNFREMAQGMNLSIKESVCLAIWGTVQIQRLFFLPNQGHFVLIAMTVSYMDGGPININLPLLAIVRSAIALMIHQVKIC